MIELQYRFFPLTARFASPVAPNTRPVDSSAVRFDQTLQPLRSFHVSPDQSLWFGSPGHGTVWNAHTCLPVTASQPRMSPRGCGGGASPGLAPVTSRFL